MGPGEETDLGGGSRGRRRDPRSGRGRAALAGGLRRRRPPRREVPPRFRVVYQGSLEATWHNNRPVQVPDPNHTFRCEGDDSSGTLTSSVRPGRNPFFITVGHELGGRPSRLVSSPNGMDKGVVTSAAPPRGS